MRKRGAQPNGGRKYLPTLSDLVDRLTIVQQKMIFIPKHRDEYIDERESILHDIDLILAEMPTLSARAIWAISVIQLANRFVWENETKIRDGTSTEPADTQLYRLRATHAVNGIRNTAKNLLAEAAAGSRVDYKIDCMASDLPAEFGSWDIFDSHVQNQRVQQAGEKQRLVQRPLSSMVAPRRPTRRRRKS